MASPTKAQQQQIYEARNLTSPLWMAFKSGMSSIDLAAATGGRVARISCASFLERAVSRGAAVRKKEKGIVRYWRTEDAPEPAAEGMQPIQPLRQSFPGRRIIPVRAGGVEMPINYSGAHYEAVGDRSGMP